MAEPSTSVALLTLTDDLLRKGQNLELQCIEDQEIVTDTIRLLRAASRKLGAEEKLLKETISQQLAEFTARRKLANARIKDLTARLTAYRAALAEQERKGRAEARDAELERAAALPAPVQDAVLEDMAEREGADEGKLAPARGWQGTASDRKTWEFDITDPLELPRWALMPNPAAVRMHMRDTLNDSKENPPAPEPVPGVRFYQRVRTIVR